MGEMNERLIRAESILVMDGVDADEPGYFVIQVPAGDEIHEEVVFTHGPLDTREQADAAALTVDGEAHVIWFAGVDSIDGQEHVN